MASFCQERSRRFWGRSPETVCAAHEVLGLLGRGEEWVSSGDGHGARGAESSPARSREGGSWQDLVEWVGFYARCTGKPSGGSESGGNVLNDHMTIWGTGLSSLMSRGVRGLGPLWLVRLEAQYWARAWL